MKYIVILLLAFAISSCATRKERAIRHLNKAITLDASVIDGFNSPIRVDTILKVDKQIVTTEKKVYLGVDEDSIRNALEKKLGVKTLLAENSKLRLELIQTKEGWFDFIGTVLPDTIHFTDTVKVNIEVPRTRTIEKRGYWYNAGIVFHVLLSFTALVLIWRLFRK